MISKKCFFQNGTADKREGGGGEGMKKNYMTSIVINNTYQSSSITQFAYSGDPNYRHSVDGTIWVADNGLSGSLCPIIVWAFKYRTSTLLFSS